MKITAYVCVIAGFITIIFSDKSSYTNGLLLQIGGCIIYQLEDIKNKIKQPVITYHYENYKLYYEHNTVQLMYLGYEIYYN